MSYIITIVKTETVEKEVKEYQKLFDSDYKSKKDEDQYGYVTTVKKVETEQTVFKQVVSDAMFCLSDIVKAINK